MFKETLLNFLGLGSNLVTAAAAVYVAVVAFKLKKKLNSEKDWADDDKHYYQQAQAAENN